MNMKKYIILFLIFYWNTIYAQSDYKQDSTAFTQCKGVRR